MLDANTIWTFREALTRAEIAGKPAIAVLLSAYDTALRQAGFLAMGGQIVDATVVTAPKQRDTEAEKVELKAGRVSDVWRAQPAKLAQKERDARWTIKWSKAKPADSQELWTNSGANAGMIPAKRVGKGSIGMSPGGDAVSLSVTPASSPPPSRRAADYQSRI
ncbi:hypothetical protein SAMN04488144_1182 [Methylobacterium sp. 190mf]|nr:hypothetical protein SAMN04488144_1182 [Methylobacterium sp. 190mf]